VIFRWVARWTLVSATLPLVDSPGDAELISAVRGGDADAYGELFSRHVEAARRLGRQLVSGPDVDDLVAEAFVKVFLVLRRGGGPDLAFRAYLLTAVRRLHVDRIRTASRLHTTDDLSPYDPGMPFRDTAVEGFENATAARAFASLPERWQTVLWHTEVEGQRPADVGLLLGMSANSVSALAYRAREGLRQAFLSMHVRETQDDACAWTHERLGAYLRTGVSRRDRARIEGHLEECRPCAAIYLELADVNSSLSGVIAPVLLGGAAAAYVASRGGAAASGGLLGLLGGARELVLTHSTATVAAGVGTGALVVGGLFVGLRAPDPDPRPAPEASGPSEVRIHPPAQPARPDDRPRGTQGTRHARVAAPPASSAPSPSPVVVPVSRPEAARPVDPGGRHVPNWPGPTPEPTGPSEPRRSSSPAGTELAVAVAARTPAGTVAAARVRVVGSSPVLPRPPARARTQVDLRITVTPRPTTGEVSLRARAGGLLAGKTATVALPPDRTSPAP
jgi:RNA polymerase sigma factor (sigma-70 family)